MQDVRDELRTEGATALVVTKMEEIACEGVYLMAVAGRMRGQVAPHVPPPPSLDHCQEWCMPAASYH